MSTKSSIILTNDDEHWYSDCAEPLCMKTYKDAITLEFSKKNVRVDMNNKEAIVLTITNPEYEIYKILSELKELLLQQEP